MSKWINENCSFCVYQIDFVCRRFPPTIDFKWDAKRYPRVWIKDPKGITQYWQNACAEYNRASKRKVRL